MDFQLSFLVHPNMFYPSTSDSGIGMANWNIFCKHNLLRNTSKQTNLEFELIYEWCYKGVFDNGEGVIC
jgi:hypothetical protein